MARTRHHSGVVVDTGYVEGVAVRADHQGHGLDRVVMNHAETIIRTRHQLGALNTHRWVSETGQTETWMQISPCGARTAGAVHGDGEVCGHMPSSGTSRRAASSSRLMP
ncbi:hypothetical protein [Mycobacterium sp. MS1601]|uniref:hypothetical protein n=1 Tax=Mycobacterium sp. MS1601 TaxID=1936029 RepID=UPI003FA5294E